MNQVFRYLHYPKQAFHQKLDRHFREREEALLLLPIIEELRAEHPGMAARELYYLVNPANMGRDKFESFCFEHGYKLERKKSFQRTTDSSGVIRFPNLLVGRELNRINQAWSSDITYYRIGDKFLYLTFILDLFSRKIVGYSVSKKLLTEQTTLPALSMALQQRNVAPGLIFHSDGGGQYYCKEFLKLTKKHEMHNSMCDSVFENSHAERINGTIKNQYLYGYGPKNYEALKEQTKRAVYNYNHIKSHSSLKKRTPAAFEQSFPAGGTSSSSDIFCSGINPSEHNQKKNHLPTRENLNLKPVEKTVNVI